MAMSEDLTHSEVGSTMFYFCNLINFVEFLSTTRIYLIELFASKCPYRFPTIDFVVSSLAPELTTDQVKKDKLEKGYHSRSVYNLEK